MFIYLEKLIQDNTLVASPYDLKIWATFLWVAIKLRIKRQVVLWRFITA